MSGLTFLHPWLLVALVPLWAGAFITARRLRARRRALPVARLALGARVLKGQPLLRALVAAPAALRLLALSALIVALARPQAEGEVTVTGEGIAIMVALDMSGSMNAVDLPEEEVERFHEAGEEPPNRFEVARDILERFIGARSEDRIGLVIFGREAYLKSPPTLDYRLLHEHLRGLVLDDGRRVGNGGGCLNECTIDGGGTAIGDALARAWRRLRRAEAKSRVIVLITDGKSEGGRVDPQTIVDELARLPAGERPKVFTILVGDPALTLTPQIDPFTGDFVRDVRGLKVYRAPGRQFPTDPELLRRIADKTGGTFWETPDEEAFRQAFRDLARTLFQREIREPNKELFVFPLLLALGMLLGEGLFQSLVLRRTP